MPTSTCSGHRPLQMILSGARSSVARERSLHGAPRASLLGVSSALAAWKTRGTQSENNGLRASLRKLRRGIGLFGARRSTGFSKELKSE